MPDPSSFVSCVSSFKDGQNCLTGILTAELQRAQLRLHQAGGEALIVSWELPTAGKRYSEGSPTAAS